MAFQELEAALGYQFTNKTLLAQALRHASCSLPKKPSYERLEFLGDRVLGLAVAELLYERFPYDPEGDLAKRHAPLVSKTVLSEIAISLNLVSYIQAETQKESGFPPSIQADVVESLLAVIYKESGFEVAKKIVYKLWGPFLKNMATAPKDPKSELQEWAHKRKYDLPLYRLTKKSGSDHAPLFLSRVTVGDEFAADGKGSSLKESERDAALHLLTKIKDIK